MSKPESAPAPETLAADDSASDHLEAARKFSWDSPTPEPKPDDKKPDPKPDDKKSTDTPPKPTDDLLKGIVNLGDAPKPDAKPEPAPLEDVAKGLVEPRADSNARAGWDQLKKIATSERDARIALEKKLTEAAKAPPSTVDEATKARLQQLETENKSYSERLKVLDLRSHPEFEEKYLKPQNEAKAALISIAKQDEVEIDIEGLLSLKGKAFNKGVSDAMDNMTQYARVQFQTELQKYITADLGAQGALKDSDKTIQEFRQNTGARSRGAFDKVAAAVSRTFPTATVADTASPEEKAEAADYNAALQHTSKVAEGYAFGQLTEDAAAEMAHKAALYDFAVGKGIPRVAKIFQTHIASRDVKIAELEKQVASLTKAAPRLDGGAGGGDTGGAPSGEDSHLDAAKKYNWSAQG